VSQDFKNAKRGTGSIFPEKVIDAGGGVKRVEALLSGKQLRQRFMFGLPLASPLTKEKLSDEDLNDYVVRAVNQVELDCKMEISPVVRRHRLAFDPNTYLQFIYLEIPNKPIQKVLRLAICSASYTDTGEPNQSAQYPSGAEIYKIPSEWIEMGNAPRGILNVNPINPAFSAIGTSTSIAASGATILQFIGQQGWVPAYWTVECLHGFCTEEGEVPVIINELIGEKASMMLIRNLLPLYRFASQSLGLDGLSQSINDMAYQLLQNKYDMLEKSYEANVKKIKTITGNNLFSSNV
jgi:hypothetical protein